MSGAELYRAYISAKNDSDREVSFNAYLKAGEYSKKSEHIIDLWLAEGGGRRRL